jgi:dipeptide/tripeptide permease
MMSVKTDDSDAVNGGYTMKTNRASRREKMIQSLKEAKETLLLFLSLPSQVFVVLLLEGLNSFRNFGLRFVQYNYFVNEFGLSDTETGSLLGLKSTLDVTFAILGSLATDALGVRKTAILALSMATIGRYLLSFGRSRTELYLACYIFSPFGEAFLSVGLYKVALKRLTTPRLRPLAFAIQYATFNFAGAICDLLIDHLRR